MSEEWIWAAVICASPFAVFGLVELGALLRRRRRDAVARRPKSHVAAPAPRPMGRAD